MRYNRTMCAQIKTVSPQQDLLEILTDYLVEKAHQHLIELSDMVVFLPNHRACTRMKAFLLKRHLYTPMLMPLAQVDMVWLQRLALNSGGEALDALHAIPNTMDTGYIQLSLAEALAERADLFTRRPAFEQCIQIAQSLVHVFEQIERGGKMPADIGRLTRLDVSEHWRERLGVLAFAADWWQRYARRHKLTTATERRNQHMRWLLKYGMKLLNDRPVIVAGSTGTQSSTVELMRAVLTMPEGEIWLPGYDRALPQSMWDSLEPTHPQYVFKRLCEQLDWDRADIQPIDDPQPSVLQLAFHGFQPHAIPNPIHYLMADDEDQEALLIAALTREALSTPEQHVAIVTANEQRIRRIQSALSAYHIQADSAVGMSVLHHPDIRSWWLLMMAAMNPHQAVAQLAAMKHPMCMLAQDEDWHQSVQQYEMSRYRSTSGTNAEESIEIFERALKPFADAMSSQVMAPIQLFEHHVTAWKTLYAVSDGVADEIIASLRPALQSLRNIHPSSYAPILVSLLQSKKYFHPGDTHPPHPRVQIYSPIEVRLMRAHRVILCGLNEGDWPAAQNHESWLHPLLSRTLGLTDERTTIGLSAHDFVSISASGQEVFWVRAKRQDGTETIPSRWLQRFAMESTTPQPYYGWLSQMRQQMEVCSVTPPAPSPPDEVRPKEYSISALEWLLRDPYGYYAKYILKLRALDALDQPADAATRGQIVHVLMQYLVESVPLNEALTPEHFHAAITSALAQHHSPLVQMQWQPRMAAMEKELLGLEHERRAHAESINAEMKLSGRLKVNEQEYSIEGRADRIESVRDGCAIIDYKTGNPPSLTDIKRGFYPQLPMLAYLATQSGHGECRELSYWKLAAVGNPVAEYPIQANIPSLVEWYHQGITRLLEKYHRATQPYIAIAQPRMQPQYNEYAHLSRQEVWLSEEI